MLTRRLLAVMDFDEGSQLEQARTNRRKEIQSLFFQNNQKLVIKTN